MEIKATSENGVLNNETVSYYNEIADSYDNILAEDGSNDLVRQKLSQVFCEIVPPGVVLDFGGGTGRDLDWLTRHQYNIIFCEPAEGMRQKAIDHNKTELHHHTIDFLDSDKTDFRNWKSAIPFVQKVDAVLANFAVLNCIPDTDLLFESLALVTRPGAHLFALILDSSLKKRFRSNLQGSLLSLFNGEPIRLNVRYKEKQHTAFIHSKNTLKKSSAPYFTFDIIEAFPSAGFVLTHLIRK